MLTMSKPVVINSKHPMLCPSIRVHKDHQAVASQKGYTQISGYCAAKDCDRVERFRGRCWRVVVGMLCYQYESNLLARREKLGTRGESLANFISTGLEKSISIASMKEGGCMFGKPVGICGRGEAKKEFPSL